MKTVEETYRHMLVELQPYQAKAISQYVQAQIAELAKKLRQEFKAQIK